MNCLNIDKEAPFVSVLSVSSQAVLEIQHHHHLDHHTAGSPIKSFRASSNSDTSPNRRDKRVSPKILYLHFSLEKIFSGSSEAFNY